MALKGKKILIGVSGSIAAYKIATLIRLLKKESCEVQVLMTEASKDFITPITLSTLSGNKVLSEFSNHQSGEWNNHVDLGMNHDIFLIAPASANTISKAANGICDNLLLAVYLSAKCPVAFAPAMDLDMFAHKSTQSNIEKLKSYGNIILEPETGSLASGLEGKGRMMEPENILTFLNSHFKKKSLLKGEKVLITAGPTFEALDPVRFIGNHSSGKMAFAIAKAFCQMGANVEMISGPVNLELKHPNLKVHKVQTALEMHSLAQTIFPKVNIAIMAAAVSDYRPEIKAQGKIKKQGEEGLTIKLIQNPDIAKELGKVKSANQILVGFALETDNLRANAEKKLKNKNFDLIVMNSPNTTDSGFGHDTNKISILDKHNNFKDIELKNKEELAYDILEAIYSIKNESL